MDDNNNDMKDKKGRKCRVTLKRKGKKKEDRVKEENRRRRRSRRTGVVIGNLSNRLRYKRFEVSTAVKRRNQHFGGAHWLHLLDVSHTTLKMEAVGSF
jgi:hypothetical protein